MKLSRAALAALAALLLACPGRANLSVVPTAPYDFKAAPLSAEASSALAFLGYRFDEASGTIRRPDGGLLTRRQMQHLLSACRVLPGSLSLDDRWSLLSGGYRIDEAKDAVLSPATHAPMTCLELAEFKLYSSRDLQQLVLERLDALLSNQDPDRPLPMEDFAKARSIARQAPLALPPSLVRAFSGPLGVRPPPTPAGIWASAVDRAYVASTRFWDGAQKHLQGLTYVSPVLPELSSAPAPRPYFDAAERDAGQDLQRAAAAYFERWPLGRELLGHFRDPNGSLRLPPFTILDLGPADLVAAVYNAHSKSIMINRSYLEKASRGLPAGSQDRNTAILKSMDVTLFHELTHAWQDRRDGLMADLDRGSAPMDIYLEYEVEAKLAGYRFLLAKMLADPSSVIGHPNLADYQKMLADFGQWRIELERLYLQGFPHLAADLATAQSIQRRRLSVIKGLLEENPDDGTLRRALKRLEEGSADLARVSDDSNDRLGRFILEELPRMRRQSYPALVEVLVREVLAAPRAALDAQRLKQAAAYADLVDDPALHRALLRRIAQAKDALSQARLP